MANPTLRLDFERRSRLRFRGSVVTSDAGLLPDRELDDALGGVMSGEMLADACAGEDGRHALIGMLRQSVFGRLSGYDEVNDAERLRRRSGDALDRRRRQSRVGMRCFGEPNGQMRIGCAKMHIFLVSHPSDCES